MITNFNKIIKSKLVQNSMWLYVLQIFNTIIPMITLPYVTRILGVAQYGVFSLALNWILYFQVIVEYGFGLTGARKVALVDGKSDLQILYNTIITSRVVLLIVSFILMNIIYLLSGMPKYHYICMCILFIMVIGVTFQQTWLFQGKQEMKLVTIVNVIARLLSVFMIFSFVKSSANLYLYCFLYSFTYLFSSLISIVVVYKKYSLVFHYAKLKYVIQELKDSWYLFTSSAMITIFGGIGITVLGVVTTHNYVGIYSAIQKIPYILTLFFSPISQVVYPHISIKFTKSDWNGIQTVKKIAFPILGIFVVIAGLIITFRATIINIAFGSEYALYANLIIPLIIWFVLGIANNFLGIQILVASGHQREYSKAFRVGVLAIVILNITLGYTFKMYGIAVAAMVSESILTVTLLVYVIRIFKGVKM
jgi:PST family polysaccharide transporter